MSIGEYFLILFKAKKAKTRLKLPTDARKEKTDPEGDILKV